MMAPSSTASSGTSWRRLATQRARERVRAGQAAAAVGRARQCVVCVVRRGALVGLPRGSWVRFSEAARRLRCLYPSAPHVTCG